MYIVLFKEEAYGRYYIERTRKYDTLIAAQEEALKQASRNPNSQVTVYELVNKGMAQSQEPTWIRPNEA